MGAWSTVMDKFVEFMVRLGAALLAGALIGLERERARVRVSRVKALPGLRSFGLVSLYGGLSGYLVSEAHGVEAWGLIATGGFVAIVLAYVVYRMFLLRAGGLTTPVLLLLSYMLGVAAGVGMVTESLAVSAIATMLLALKTPVTRLVRKVSYEELLALFELALLYLAFAPLVYAVSGRISIAGVSPATIYTFFLVVLSMSFAGYVAWRVGANPILYALFGGMVNSEAAVALIARQVLDPTALEALIPYVYIGMQSRAVLLSLAALVLAGRLEAAYAALPFLLTPLAVNTMIAGLYRRRVEARLGQPAPLDYSVALKTVALYFLLLLVSAAFSNYLRSPPLLALYAFIGGLVNATASILALSSLPLSSVTAGSVYSIVITAATLSKVIYARMVSRRAAGIVLRSSLIYSASFAVSAVLGWLQAMRI